jgi:hypothetical protein
MFYNVEGEAVHFGMRRTFPPESQEPFNYANNGTYIFSINVTIFFTLNQTYEVLVVPTELSLSIEVGVAEHSLPILAHRSDVLV